MLQVKQLQNDQNQNVLLIVHDESGRSHDLINKLIKILTQKAPDDPNNSDK